MIKKIFILFFGNIKLFFIKLFHFNNFKYNFYNNVSLNSEIELKKYGKVCFGKKFILRRNCRISSYNGNIIFGNNCGINNNCYIVSHESILIGNNVEIGPNCVIVDHDHDYKREFELNGSKRFFKTSGIEIGDNVWIGANVIILRGTKIGNNCGIGAGSIVKGNYEDNSIIIQKRMDVK